MAVEVQLNLDVKEGLRTITVTWPHDTRDQARDQIMKALNSSETYTSIRDVETGDHIALNTMKVSDAVVKEKEE